ncbi:MAG: tyrosine-type recombinase/integrase [Planctomycetales bacterium]|nr:tyrosine-type recombinase/integrase [Planctomycetales bacterium]
MISGPESESELVLPWRSVPSSESIVFWLTKYWQNKVLGSPEGTVRAKKSDLELFVLFFCDVVGSDSVDFWTPSVTKSFRSWMAKAEPLQPKRRFIKAYAPTSINRTLATLRHFAKFVMAVRPFESGDPFDGVGDLTIQEPGWKGLSDLELMRLRAALDQLTQLSNRKHQMPFRNRAIFLTALDTGLRASELVNLDFDQLGGKYLHKVKGKGNSYADIYLSSDARPAILKYIESERGDSSGPLFVTNRGGRISRQQIDRFLRQVASQANSKLPSGEHISLHAHALRHTGTKRVYLTKGPVEAKQFGRHQSFKQLERYAAQTPEEREAMVDKLWD